MIRRSLVAAILLAESNTCRVRGLMTPNMLSKRYSTNLSVSQEIEKLVSHPAAQWNESASLAAARKKLKRRHQVHFQDSSSQTDLPALFDKFAFTLCQAGTVPRKELFETWAAALLIHEHHLAETVETASPRIRRIVDVAGGHGLLCWALLVIDDHFSNLLVDDTNQPPPLTAFCLDSTMPKSADAIELVMLQNWPHLEGQFHFVEAWLEQLRPHPSCLMVAVHACGTLSDMLVATAAATNSPIAVVPCCHTRKKKKLEPVAEDSLAKEEYMTIIELSPKTPMPDLADTLDDIRMKVLDRADFDVAVKHLPEAFTGQTRLILGTPRQSMVEGEIPIGIGAEFFFKPQKETSGPRKGSMVKMSTKEKFLRKFDVPCEDSEEARETIRELAGREEATKRRQALKRKKHNDAPQYDFSLFLPPNDLSTDQWEDRLAALASGLDESRPECVVTKVRGAFFHEASGRTAQTYRVVFYSDIEKKIAFPDEKAKSIYEKLSEEIPKVFLGTQCR